MSRTFPDRRSPARRPATLPWLLVWLLGLSVAAHAAQVRRVQAVRQDGLFLIDMRIAFAAPHAAVFRALRDYHAIPLYDPEVRDVHTQATSSPDRMRVSMRIHTCVLLFCKTIHQSELMRTSIQSGAEVLEAEFLPADGAFQGHGRWLIRPCLADNAPTCMDVRLELRAQFWIPPVIGPWIVRRKMREEALHLSAGLEQLATGAMLRGSHPCADLTHRSCHAEAQAWSK